MIMHKKGVGGGGGGVLKMSWLAYNIVHGIVSKQNVYIYNVKKINRKLNYFLVQN